MALEELAKKYGFKLQGTNDDYYFKPTFTNWGDKGVGKTSFAFSAFAGTIVALSYDGKSRIIKKKFVDLDPKNKDRIIVEDLTIPDYNDDSISIAPEFILDTGELVVEQTRYILANYKPDWFLFDGEDLLVQHCEMYMRKRQGIMPFEGFKNLNLWKERNAYIRQLHRLAQRNARVGVIYNTTYQIEEVDRAGETKKIEKPKWADLVMYETDFAFHIFTAHDSKTGRERFYARVTTTKYDSILPYGKLFDVTDYPVLFTPTMFLPNAINNPPNQTVNTEVNKENKTDKMNDEVKKEDMNSDWDV